MFEGHYAGVRVQKEQKEQKEQKNSFWWLTAEGWGIGQI